MTTTATPPRKLPKLDRDRIARAARETVRQELKNCRTPETLLRRSTQIVQHAEEVIEQHRPTRDEAALSLALHEGRRAVNDVIGVHRSYFYGMRTKALRLTEEEKAAHWLEESAPGVRRTKEEVQARAFEVGVPIIEDAASLAAHWGEQVALADEQATAAREIRDNAIRTCWDNGWSRGRIAAIAGVDESRISQIVGEAKA
jgi:hypothetical protein